MERYRPPYWAVAFPLPAAPCSPSHHRQDEPAAWRVGPRASKAGWQAWTDEPYHHPTGHGSHPHHRPPGIRRLPRGPQNIRNWSGAVPAKVPASDWFSRCSRCLQVTANAVSKHETGSMEDCRVKRPVGPGHQGLLPRFARDPASQSNDNYCLMSALTASSLA